MSTEINRYTPRQLTLLQFLLLYESTLFRHKGKKTASEGVEAMQKPPERFKNPQHFMNELSRQLRMAYQHAECAKKSTYQPLDFLYYLFLCWQDIERARSLLEEL